MSDLLISNHLLLGQRWVPSTPKTRRARDFGQHARFLRTPVSTFNNAGHAGLIFTHVEKRLKRGVFEHFERRVRSRLSIFQTCSGPRIHQMIGDFAVHFDLNTSIILVVAVVIQSIGTVSHLDVTGKSIGGKF